jgi:hypothetical protein
VEVRAQQTIYLGIILPWANQTFTDLVISDSYISIVGSVLEYYHFNFSIAVNVKL